MLLDQHHCSVSKATARSGNGFEKRRSIEWQRGGKDPRSSVLEKAIKWTEILFLIFALVFPALRPSPSRDKKLIRLKPRQETLNTNIFDPCRHRFSLYECCWNEASNPLICILVSLKTQHLLLTECAGWKVPEKTVRCSIKVALFFSPLSLLFFFLIFVYLFIYFKCWRVYWEILTSFLATLPFPFSLGFISRELYNDAVISRGP